MFWYGVEGADVKYKLISFVLRSAFEMKKRAFVGAIVSRQVRFYVRFVTVLRGMKEQRPNITYAVVATRWGDWFGILIFVLSYNHSIMELITGFVTYRMDCFRIDNLFWVQAYLTAGLRGSQEEILKEERGGSRRWRRPHRIMSEMYNWDLWEELDPGFLLCRTVISCAYACPRPHHIFKGWIKETLDRKSSVLDHLGSSNWDGIKGLRYLNSRSCGNIVRII